MTISVPLAIRNAVASARVDSGANNSKWYPFGKVALTSVIIFFINFIFTEGTTNVENVFVNSLNNYTQYVL